MNEIDLAFESLFYGSGAFLGVLLLLTIGISLLLMWKWSGAFLLPVYMIIEVDYYDRVIAGNQSLVWYMFIFLLFSVFTITYMVAKKD